MFAKDEFDLGNFTYIEHAIDTAISETVVHAPSVIGLCSKRKMLHVCVIEPFVFEWWSAPVYVRNRDGSVSWCVDYQTLNKVTVKVAFTLPHIEDMVNMLAGQLLFSKLDTN
ncbi:MAG: hypothetical protein ABW185_07160 [Sedimenticola sp.]